ncbi:MAG: hypothetical protein H0V73_08060 [Chloroflexi bacterium]|nr:hypothetical protein [Chloroflexota bacterium]
MGQAPAALAGAAVDADSLVPPPPPGATCSADGRYVICSTTFFEAPVDEPAFELPCGQVYVTATDNRAGRRWYVDGKLVRRHVVQEVAGTFSLSTDGSTPAISFVSHTQWGEVYRIPGDLDTADGQQSGTDLLGKSANGGVLFHISGRTNGDEEFTGKFQAPEDPAIADVMCEALGG